MDILWEELSFGLPGSREVTQVVIRLLAAVLAGAVIGYERERAGKAAGLRTHILVSLGTCLFVLAGISYGMTSEGLSRVIQGIVTGIGFIGAGTILKLENKSDIQGLTTAAGVWMTAAIGVAIGLGEIGLALISAAITVLVLSVLGRFDRVKAQKVENGKQIPDPKT
jgi:putative Mg2+ transporter-C (MgtC) family protein